MKRIHIIGGKNQGKTTLVIELVQELSKLGLRVGTIKHTHHEHELDTPGKDSHRHREAGAAVSGIYSRRMNAVFWPHESTGESRSDAVAICDKYDSFAPMFKNCDLVLVEGDVQTTAIKLEVWRSALGTVPLAQSDATIAAVITDDLPPDSLSVPLWPRGSKLDLARKLIAIAIPEQCRRLSDVPLE